MQTIGTGLARTGFAAMAVLAVAVAFYSLRFAAVPTGYWLAVDPGIRAVVMRDPLAALSHMLVSPAALMLGPFQFWPGLRARHLRTHRWIGRVYGTACTLGGIGGFATALHASGGPIAGFGFGLLAVLWVGTTLWAWQAAVVRNIALHRLLMRFSYAMTFGAVTLRLQIPIGFLLGFPSYSAMSVWLAYTAWLPNVAAVGLYTLLNQRHRATPAMASIRR